MKGITMALAPAGCAASQLLADPAAAIDDGCNGPRPAYVLGGNVQDVLAP